MTLRHLAATIAELPNSPGVYRMLDAGGELLYVGKARNLRNRVQSYLRAGALTARMLSMTQGVAKIEVTVTRSEDEALLLENNLIKSERPRYNVKLRDDKSYPYIFVSEPQTFPRLAFHRGAKREPGRYFGPFPSASAVRETLSLVQKIFLLRLCEDSFFRNRSRPCLQHQIKRCTAPCVGYIDEASYRRDVRQALMFLEGKSRAVIEEVTAQMETASARQAYEDAARYRDRIAVLKRVQERQYMSRDSGDADAVAIVARGAQACVEIAFIRGGLNLGSKRFFPNNDAGLDEPALLAAFLPQYYLDKQIPPRIYLDKRIAERALLERVFSRQAGSRVRIAPGARGAPRSWLKLAALNAREALARLAADRSQMLERFEALQGALRLEAMPQRLECFDISHTFGEATVASCVVFDPGGAVKSDYRRFNIEGVTAGDDYGALRQALERRFRRMKSGEAKVPDLLFIDGGKGQVAVALEVLPEYQLGDVRVIGVAKGPGRKPGQERLFLSGTGAPSILPPDSPALHLIQQIRDEAHRFAITGHRLRRARARTQSPLEQIEGIGERRRQTLLRNFGGLRGLARAGVDEIARVPGISAKLAQRIFDVLHG